MLLFLLLFTEICLLRFHQKKCTISLANLGLSDRSDCKCECVYMYMCVCAWVNVCVTVCVYDHSLTLSIPQGQCTEHKRYCVCRVRRHFRCQKCLWTLVWVQRLQQISCRPVLPASQGVCVCACVCCLCVFVCVCGGGGGCLCVCMWCVYVCVLTCFCVCACVCVCVCVYMYVCVCVLDEWWRDNPTLSATSGSCWEMSNFWCPCHCLCAVLWCNPMWLSCGCNCSINSNKNDVIFQSL